MMLLKSPNFRNTMKFFVILKIIAFIILIWIYETDKYTFIFRNFKEKFNVHRTLNRNFYRSLGVYKNEMNFKNRTHGENVSDHRKYKNMTNNMNDKAPYEYLKKNRLSELESYNKDYKKRYSKKKGLAKLECYCEQKLFNSFTKIVRHAEEKKLSKKHINRILYKKYGLPLFTLSLMPLLGLILTIWYIIDPHIHRECLKLKGTVDSQPYETDIHPKCYLIPNVCVYVNNIFFFLLILIIILLIFYLIIKSAKYERIKHGY